MVYNSDMKRRKQRSPGKPYDATTKTLVETNPKAWLEFLNLPGTVVEIANTDLSTVTTEADSLIIVREPFEYILHHEFQAGPDITLPMRSFRYGLLAIERHGMPVHTIIVLLRPEADSYKNITGELDLRNARSEISMFFRYDVIRLWEVPVDTILQSDAALLPLALLCDLSGTSPAQVVERLNERFTSDVPPETARLLWTATYILLGLTYQPDLIEKLMSGVTSMKESVTYQKILAEGEARGEARGEVNGRLLEAQNMLLLIGEGRLGKPEAGIVKAVRAIKSIEMLEDKAIRLLAVESWTGLLAG